MPQPSPLILPLSRGSRRCTLSFSVQSFNLNRLNRAGRGGAQNPQAHRLIGVGVVHERFLSMQLEDCWREKGALRVSEAPVQINNNSHSRTLFALSSDVP